MAVYMPPYDLASTLALYLYGLVAAPTIALDMHLINLVGPFETGICTARPFPKAC